MMYLDAVVNKETGQSAGPYDNYGTDYDYVGGTGWNTSERKVDSVDLFTDGNYELVGTSVYRDAGRQPQPANQPLPEHLGQYLS